MNQQLNFALNITAPILILLILGLLFRRIRLIDEHFISAGNAIVYNIALPTLLFFSTVAVPLRQSFDLRLLGFGVVSTLMVVFVLWVISPLFVSDQQRGVFIQGAFRGNMGIIGIALVLNAFGSAVLPKAGIYLALLTILYNFLSVWVLRPKTRSFLWIFLKNPLIIAVFLGFAWSMSGVAVPAIIRSAGDYISQLALPLALICVGGSLSWASFRINHSGVVWASIFKLILIPWVVTSAAVMLGFTGADLGLLFLMMSAPSAAASYVMAEKMAGQGAMAAEIIALTTVAGAFTITFGLVVLKGFGYI